METKSWAVKSNTFGREYQISGSDIKDAILSNFETISKHAKIPGTAKVNKVTVVFQPMILKSQGGVELTVDYSSAGRSEQAVVWVHASPNDMPDGPLNLSDAFK
ncbi:hypothetical protein ACFOY8_14070 [Thalassospira xianhensis]|uniref:Uncharacterized protein n=1 Tax=Thalassospira xianhensis MCCC 1A02616 TaxID=1177929 RepID=A0A367UK57_9PROT|nr:hypothetical protein [Thalassospira xianhensis]RCK07714.1 hypothetical protein TH5_01200 [Thalassospira xianhensis MCCC 1A02616]